jgi:hypothetical protein
MITLPQDGDIVTVISVLGDRCFEGHVRHLISEVFDVLTAAGNVIEENAGLFDLDDEGIEWMRGPATPETCAALMAAYTLVYGRRVAGSW